MQELLKAIDLVKKLKETKKEFLSIDLEETKIKEEVLEKYLYSKKLISRIEIITYFLENYEKLEKKEKNGFSKIVYFLESDFSNLKLEEIFNCIFYFQFSSRKTIKKVLFFTKYLKESNFLEIETSINLHDSLLYFSNVNSKIESNLKSKEKESEYEYEKRVIENFSIIFPNFKFIKNQVVLEGNERIDILAESNSSKRKVIIELKINNKNPKRQLLLYASYYENPILISLTKEECKNKHKDIIYMVYE